MIVQRHSPFPPRARARCVLTFSWGMRPSPNQRTQHSIELWERTPSNGPRWFVLETIWSWRGENPKAPTDFAQFVERCNVHVEHSEPDAARTFAACARQPNICDDWHDRYDWQPVESD